MRWWSPALVALGGCSFELAFERGLDATGPAIDAPPVCPATFVTMLAGSSSKYRIVGNELSWRAAEAACEQLTTHLFVPNSNAETAAMRALLDGTRHWVGIAQVPGETIVNASWRLVTGGALTADWLAGKPDDNGGEDGEEQAGSLNDDGLDDDRHRDTKPYICECDGAPVDASVVMMLPL